MIYFRDTTDFYMAGPTAVTLGKFDGLHLGHQKLIRRILSCQEDKVSSVVFALNARPEDMILTDSEQKRILDEMGITCLIRCPFVPEISHLSPEDFIRDILVNRLHVHFAAVGTDFRFGYQRRGDAQFLKEYAGNFGIDVEIMEKECYEGREISSTYVREALMTPDPELASRLMGRDYAIEGRVIHGRHIGTGMGMPTANLIPPLGKLLPPNGVYVTQTYVDGKSYRSVTNIGTKPTVDGSFRGVETYLLDKSMDLYGKEICVALKAFLRPEHRFSSLEELKKQIQKDIDRGRSYFL